MNGGPGSGFEPCVEKLVEVLVEVAHDVRTGVRDLVEVLLDFEHACLFEARDAHSVGPEVCGVHRALRLAVGDVLYEVVDRRVLSADVRVHEGLQQLHPLERVVWVEHVEDFVDVLALEPVRLVLAGLAESRLQLVLLL